MLRQAKRDLVLLELSIRTALRVIRSSASRSKGASTSVAISTPNIGDFDDITSGTTAPIAADIDRGSGKQTELAAEIRDAISGPDYYTILFDEWERQGFHVTRSHFYSPIATVSEIADDVWQPRETVGIDWNEKTQIEFYRSTFRAFRTECEQWPDSSRPTGFHFRNGGFDGTDAIALYCMVRHLHPKRIIEIGSGYSTVLMNQALAKNGTGELLCIDPFVNERVPRDQARISIIEQPVQKVDDEMFRQLGENDILFIDSSHVSRVGSDVNRLYLEIVPRLSRGVVIHIHDVFLPNDYPKEFVTKHRLFWNEQYLVQAFLMFNRSFEILLSNAWLGHRYPAIMREAFPKSPWYGGGSLWIRRRADD